MRLSPKEAMLMAIAEGKKGAGFVSPNPLVGCVILSRAGELLAVGHHARLGAAHAEVAALNQIQNSQQLEGAQVFVTLEPCAHQGRTPSCAKALAQLPIARVVYGLVDPDPRVRGQGAEILRQAGKVVALYDDLASELEELSEIFLLNQRQRRPFVALKVASSLDGQIALRNGASRWITGEASRAHVHELRGAYDAVLIGSGTFLHDNPRLNSRASRFSEKPSRVILLDPDGRAKIEGSALLEVRPPESVFVVTGPDAEVSAPVKHLKMTSRDFAMPELLKRLHEHSIHSVFIEGGAGVYASFMAQGLVDRLYLFMAPVILGQGLSWSSEFFVAGSDLQRVPRLANLHTKRFGEDIFLTGRPVFP